MRVGSGAVQPGDAARRRARPRRVPPARQDLRHRHRRRCSGPSAIRALRRQAGRVGARGSPGTLLRSKQREFRGQQRRPPCRHLRPQRPCQGCADLQGRSAGLPQHADVHDRRYTAKRFEPVALRACATRFAVSGSRRDVAESRRPVRPRRHGQPHLPQGAGHAHRRHAVRLVDADGPQGRPVRAGSDPRVGLSRQSGARDRGHRRGHRGDDQPPGRDDVRPVDARYRTAAARSGGVVPAARTSYLYRAGEGRAPVGPGFKTSS